MKVWDLSIRQPVFMTMILLAFVVLGIVSFTRMPVDLFPDVEFPIVSVTTVYPGAGPDEVESQVTEVVEEAVSTLPGVESVSSTSSEGFSLVIVEFSLDFSDTEAAREVLEEINQIRNQLPDDAQDPVVQRFDPASQPILVVGVADTAGSYTPIELRQLVEEIVQRPLERVPGVAAVEVEGGQTREIQVNLDLQALQARRIAPQQVVGALQAENLSVPGGQVVEGRQQVLVRTPGYFQTIEDVRNVVVSQRSAPIYLSDVATVVDGVAERETLTRLNGQDSVVLNIRKQSGTNTVQVANRVKEALREIEAANPNLNIAVGLDSSVFVQQATDDALMDLLLGGLLAGLVVLFFFRNVRNTFITMSGLPIIMLGTIALMDAFGLTLNMVTLLALALVVGLVIDDAIVVRENIFRWVEKGYSAREAASKATEEVALPVLATSATIVAVFLPVAYAEGLAGQFLGEFGFTVVFAIVISTFEALTLAPMLSAYFFAAGEEREREIDESAGEEKADGSWLDRTYGRALDWVLRHRGVAVLVSVVVLVASVGSAFFINQSFVPNLDQGQFDVTMEMPAGTALQTTAAEAAQVEAILLSHSQVESVFTTIGGRGTPEQAKFSVTLKGGAETSSRPVMEQLREPLAAVPGIAFRVSDNAFGADRLLGNRDIIVEVTALNGDFDALVAGGRAMMALLEGVEGLTDVEMSYREGKPEVHVDVDRRRAAEFGLNTAQIGATVRTLVNGEIASTFRGEGAEADIRVQLREEDLVRVQDLLKVNLLSSQGQLVPLGNVAALTATTGPTQIQRSDRQPTLSVVANVRAGYELPVLQLEVEDLVAAADLPTGVVAQMGGTAELQEETFGNLFLALALAVVFIYMVLASQFSSFIQPFLIMLAMPLAVVGAIVSLVLTGNPLDMTAMIGFILLMGLVTKNSILLVDFANRERARGRSATHAMHIAGPVRLRPILMTSISLILGMIPIALGLGPGGDFRAPMAIGIIGGMVTSTLLTLFVVPVAYSLLVGWQDRRIGRRRQSSSLSVQSSRVGEEQVPQPGD